VREPGATHAGVLSLGSGFSGRGAKAHEVGVALVDGRIEEVSLAGLSYQRWFMIIIDNQNNRCILKNV